MNKHFLKSPASLWTLIWGILFAFEVYTSIRFSGGHLIYSLDDPYIHLSVAENILRGGYGVNWEEFSAPSSSILYPFLLVPFVAIGIGPFAPLIINAAAMGASVWLLADFFWRYGAGKTPLRLFAHVITFFLILSINAIALPMTGMEHSLQILAVVITMRGLVTMAETGKVPVLLAAGVIVMPFIRFEGMALAGAAILAMAISRHRLQAAFSFLLILAGLGAWAVFMSHLGLPFFPSSVTLKSAAAAGVSAHGTGKISQIFTGLGRNFAESLGNRFGIVFALAICLLIATAQDKEGRWLSVVSLRGLIAGVMILALGAHLLAGQYGWLHRYEVYAVAILLMGGIIVMQPWLLRLNSNAFIAGRIGLYAAMICFSGPYASAVFITPFSSRSIYEQQYQMHRFVTEYFPYPAAVNDLGLVSYQNDHFILDLFGLGSEKVRKLKAEGNFNATTIEKLTNEAHADLAMIFAEWFTGITPNDWCLMAVMTTEKGAFFNEVLFYATRPEAIPALREALDKFAPTLPPMVILKLSAACS